VEVPIIAPLKFICQAYEELSIKFYVLVSGGGGRGGGVNSTVVRILNVAYVEIISIVVNYLKLNIQIKYTKLKNRQQPTLCYYVLY
jgi:hypothetical protein